jgi:hypothetical protein
LATAIDHAAARAWLASIRVRAELVRFLLLGGDPTTPVHEAGVELSGAWIAGALNLQGCERVRPVRAWQSRFDTAPILRSADCGDLILSGSAVPGLSGDGMRCRGRVFLRGQFHSSGSIRLLGVAVAGPIDLHGAALHPSQGEALNLDGAIAAGGLFLNRGFNARGEVRLLAARVTGDFDCSGGNFRNPHGDALTCERANIAGNLYLNRGFRSEGVVSLVGAQVAGTLAANDARLINPASVALWGDRARIDGDVDLSRNFGAHGRIVLRGIRIGGTLTCSGAILLCERGPALILDHSRIGINLTLDQGFKVYGEVILIGAHIGSSMQCGAAEFIRPNGDALSCDGATFGGDVFFRDDFKSTGAVRLLGAKIAGDLDCNGGSFANPGGYALNCERARIDGGLFLRGLKLVEGAISLASATATSLVDDDRSQAGANMAPPPWYLGLDGFTYQRISDAPTDARSRIAWLRSQIPEHLTTDFRPQPWEQCIKVLREMGHPEEARRVAMAKEWLILGNAWRRWLINCPTWRSPLWAAKLVLMTIYGLLTGFGHRPLRTVAAMLLVWLGCAHLYGLAADLGVLAPTTPLIHLHTQADGTPLATACKPIWTACPAPPMPREYTTFNAHLYSLDLLLPLVDLQQNADWAPMVDAAKPFWALASGYPIRALMWFEILFGWAASLLLAAVLSGLAKKD